MVQPTGFCSRIWLACQSRLCDENVACRAFRVDHYHASRGLRINSRNFLLGGLILFILFINRRSSLCLSLSMCSSGLSLCAIYHLRLGNHFSFLDHCRTLGYIICGLLVLGKLHHFDGIGHCLAIAIGEAHIVSCRCSLTSLFVCRYSWTTVLISDLRNLSLSLPLISAFLGRAFPLVWVVQVSSV